MKDMSYRLLFCFFILSILSCVTTAQESTRDKDLQSRNEDESPGLSDLVREREERDYPDWFVKPPLEEGYLFGIGIDKDSEKAKQKSIVDIAYQMSVHVEASLYDRAQEDNGQLTEQVTRIGDQVSRSTVVGTKFYDRYESADGYTYILSRSPLECTMGAIESLLISYRRDLEDIGIELDEVQELMDEKIDFYRNDLQVEWLIHKPVYEFPEMVRIEGGSYYRGNNELGGSELIKDDAYLVELSSYEIGKYEISQKEWMDVMGFTLAMQRDRADSNWQFYGEGDDYPMYYVSFADIAIFCNKLSTRGGLEPCYTVRGNFVSCDFSKNGFRLPTEAEWEFAALGGVENPSQQPVDYNALGTYGWSKENSGKSAHTIGTKRANRLGLYDMGGNVWELVWDWYSRFGDGMSVDPKGPDEGTDKVIKGGSWTFDKWATWPGSRKTANPESRTWDVGFRVARTL